MNFVYQNKLIPSNKIYKYLRDKYGFNIEYIKNTLERKLVFNPKKKQAFDYKMEITNIRPKDIKFISDIFIKKMRSMSDMFNKEEKLYNTEYDAKITFNVLGIKFSFDKELSIHYKVQLKFEFDEDFSNEDDNTFNIELSKNEFILYLSKLFYYHPNVEINNGQKTFTFHDLNKI